MQLPVADPDKPWLSGGELEPAAGVGDDEFDVGDVAGEELKWNVEILNSKIFGYCEMTNKN